MMKILQETHEIENGPTRPGMCILPFCWCVYKEYDSAYGAMCAEVSEAPFNSDASCFKLSWKRDYVGRSASGDIPILVPRED